MGREVVQTKLELEEYSRLAATAQKRGLTIKEALREAAVQWTFEESAINPNGPIFQAKAKDWGKGTESVARDHDKYLYGGKLRPSDSSPVLIAKKPRYPKTTPKEKLEKLAEDR